MRGKKKVRGREMKREGRERRESGKRKWREAQIRVNLMDRLAQHSLTLCPPASSVLLTLVSCLPSTCRWC